MFSGYNGSAERFVNECEDFNLEDKKGNRLMDIFTKVEKYGINKKEGKMNVFGVNIETRTSMKYKCFVCR